MSLDAVDRQHMPFVGETGGGLGQGEAAPARPSDGVARPTERRIALPTAAACRPTRPWPTASPRRVAAPSASRPRGAAGAAARPDAAVTAPPGRSSPAVGGTRQVPAPDPIAEDYLLLGLRLDQRIPGLVDGYFGPAELKARVDMEQFRAAGPAARGRGRAARAARGRGRGARASRLARSPRSGRSRRTRRRSMASRCRTPTTSRCASASRRRATTTMAFARRSPRSDALLPGDGPRHERLAAWDRTLEIPVDRLPDVIDWLVGAVPRPRSTRLRPARRRGPACLARHRPAVVRLQLVRRRAALAGRRQHRPAGPRPGPHHDDRPRDLPGPPSRACLEGGGPRRWAGPARELDAADQHARMPDQRGPGRPRALVRRSARRATPTSCVELFERAGLAVAADPVEARETAERAVGAGRTATPAGARAAATPP